MTGIAADFRSAWRALLRSPLHTTLGALMLAVGIGASAGIFGIVDAVLLRPLDYAEPARLVWLCEESASVDYCTTAPPNAYDWAALSRTLEGVGVARGWQYSLRRGERARGLNAGIVTPELFGVLGVRPQLGRLLQPEDQRGEGAKVVVLSDAMWRREYGARRDVVGTTLSLDGEPYEIVGVAPAGFSVPGVYEPELWKPLHIDPRSEEHREWRGFGSIARVRPGVSAAALRADLDRVAARLAAAHPGTNQGYGIRVQPLHERVVGPARPMLLLFAGAVALVLLIVCANTANLLLARAARRQFELAVRQANGASRLRLVRQLLFECALLSGAGALGGVLIAGPGTRALLALAPAALPRVEQVGTSGAVLAFALALAVTTTFAAGLLPALWASRANVQQLLRTADARVGSGFGRGRAALVVLEVALSVMLLAGAGVLLRSLAQQLRWDPGFPRDGLLMTQIFPPSDEFEDSAQLTAFYERAQEALRAVPGVTRVGSGSAGPIFGGLDAYRYRVDGRADDAGSARTLDVDEGYFGTLGLGIVRGRDFAATDGPGSPRVAIVNEQFARLNWQDADPIGRRIELLEAEWNVQVVGVVRDANAFPGDEDMSGAAIYIPQRQEPRGATFLVLRTSVPPEGLIEAVQQRLLALEPDLSIGRTTTMELQVAAYTARPRFNLLILGLFSATALLLALAGLYSVIAYTAAQRTREFGIRLALGGRPRDIVALMLGQSARMIGAGVLFGSAGALLAAGALEKLVFGVDPRDPVTYLAAAAVLAFAALLATLAPAVRAARQDPSWALRES